MPEKLLINLGDIQKTLLLPLWGRAVATQKTKPLIVDETAVEIINKIDYDFSKMAANLSEITKLAWIGRCVITDKICRKFLEKHPGATIVNMGCGLDTTFNRVDNGLLHWYDLDLPDVIELRKNFIPETERNKCVAYSVLDCSWINNITPDDSILLIANGVLYYFEENQVRDLLIKIACSYPGSEILFDVASPLGVKMSNKMVIKNSGLDEKSFLKWGIANYRDMQLWDSRIRILNKYSFFKDFKNELMFKDRIGCFISDLLRIMYMVHLKILK
jgi:O-methyltransferase involved in polyketide biosynthesis